MKNKFVIALLFLPVFILGGVMAYYEYAAHFSRVEVVVEGFDPKDFFSGYFMELQPNWAKTDCTQFATGECPTEAFEKHYRYYINREQSEPLTLAVNSGMAKLVFSYAEGRVPRIIDLLIDDKSYTEYVAAQKNSPKINGAEQPRNIALPPHHRKDGILQENKVFYNEEKPTE